MYSCDGKAEFSVVIQSSLSHDPLETFEIEWFVAHGIFIIPILKSLVLLNYFEEKHDIFFQGSWTKFKQWAYLFEM